MRFYSQIVSDLINLEKVTGTPLEFEKNEILSKVQQKIRKRDALRVILEQMKLHDLR